MLTLKKGNTVEVIKSFSLSGNKVDVGTPAIIVKGGKTIKLTTLNKGENFTFSLKSEHAKEYFKDIIVEEKTELNLRKISFKKLKFFETHRGAGFSADVIFEGVKVGSIDNAGSGGETVARFYGDDREKLKEILSIISRFKKPSSYESEGDIIENFMNYKISPMRFIVPFSDHEV